MSRPILSVEQEGDESILHLRNVPGVLIGIRNCLREGNEYGLESDLDRDDLDKFKRIIGSVNVVLEIPQ